MSLQRPLYYPRSFFLSDICNKLGRVSFLDVQLCKFQLQTPTAAATLLVQAWSGHSRYETKARIDRFNRRDKWFFNFASLLSCKKSFVIESCKTDLSFLSRNTGEKTSPAFQSSGYIPINFPNAKLLSGELSLPLGSFRTSGRGEIFARKTSQSAKLLRVPSELLITRPFCRRQAVFRFTTAINRPLSRCNISYLLPFIFNPSRDEFIKLRKSGREGERERRRRYNFLLSRKIVLPSSFNS